MYVGMYICMSLHADHHGKFSTRLDYCKSLFTVYLSYGTWQK